MCGPGSKRIQAYAPMISTNGVGRLPPRIQRSVVRRRPSKQGARALLYPLERGGCSFLFRNLNPILRALIQMTRGSERLKQRIIVCSLKPMPSTCAILTLFRVRPAQRYAGRAKAGRRGRVLRFIAEAT